ncbi:hypothetical protein THRCLA_01493 [Thraustotheca clavata]|uniref:Secreted protein n=1 Tax=Thraustotheca clavata TaxID=74557 RepID=A0A1W0A850_9STRA|nr:hypothetical protein THRCLA_01493 [Thraustotheca clavata]
MILRCVVYHAVLLPFVLAQGNVCCHVCLQTLGPSTYDPAVFDQCNLKKPGCCFCSSQMTIPAPSYSPTQVAGTWQKVNWPGVSKVTMVNVAAGNEAQAHPQLTLLLAGVTQDAAGNYLFCADNPGTILIRGWGPLANDYPSNCTAISAELSINITAGGTAKCSDAKPGSTTVKPNSGSSTSSTSGTSTPGGASTKVACDANRGYIQDNKCYCLSDYAGPPTCDGMALWKILVSVAGGLAALFSIIVSVRQFLLFRKRKEEEKRLNESMANQSSKNFDTMYGMPPASMMTYYDTVNATGSRHTESRDVRPSESAESSRLSRPSEAAAQETRLQPRESKEYTL